jgi:hypothetical protein
VTALNGAALSGGGAAIAKSGRALLCVHDRVVRQLPILVVAICLGYPASAQIAERPYEPSPATKSEPLSSLPPGSRCFSSTAQFDRAVQLEMAALGLVAQASTGSPRAARPLRFVLTQRAPGDEPIATLTISCSESVQLANLGVQFTDGDENFTRSIDLSDVPDESRSRTLAIALMELVRTTRNAAQARSLERERAELQRLAATLEEQARAPRQASPNANAAPPLPSSPGLRPWQVGVSGLATLTFDGKGQMLGGELSAFRRLSPNWRGALEVPLLRSQPETDFGRLDVTRWGVSAGVDWNATSVSSLLIGPRLHWVRFAALGNSRLGVPESTQHGFGLAATLRVSFEVEVSESLALRTTLDGGATLRSMVFTGGGRRAFAYDGAQAMWGVGAAWRP